MVPIYHFEMRSGIWRDRSSIFKIYLKSQILNLFEMSNILNLFEMSSSTFVWNQRSPLIQSHCFMNTCTECSGCSQIRQMVVFWLPSILFHFPWQTLQCTANADQSPSYMSRCTVIQTFLAIFPTAPKSYATIFLGGTEDLISVQLTLIMQKISKKVDFCQKKY